MKLVVPKRFPGRPTYLFTGLVKLCPEVGQAKYAARYCPGNYGPFFCLYVCFNCAVNI